MSLIFGLVILLIIVGICLYLIPMDAAIKSLVIKIITVVAVIVVILWLLQLLGIAVPSLRIR